MTFRLLKCDVQKIDSKRQASQKEQTEQFLVHYLRVAWSEAHATEAIGIFERMEDLFVALEVLKLGQSL